MHLVWNVLIFLISVYLVKDTRYNKHNLSEDESEHYKAKGKVENIIFDIEISASHNGPGLKSL